MSRTACVCAGGCLLLLLTIVAAEAYDEEPGAETMDDFLMYQGENDIATNPATFTHLPDRSADLLLDRLIQAKLLENHNFYRSRWDSPYMTRLLHILPQKRIPGFFNLNLKLKDSKISVQDGKRTSKLRDRPQPKWKIKKGRVSSGVVCYFKLCAFRASN